MVFDGPSTDKPHMGAIVLESTVSGEGEVLRSEVAAAIALLRHQFHRGDFRRHCILPVRSPGIPCSLSLSIYLSSPPPPFCFFIFLFFFFF